MTSLPTLEAVPTFGPRTWWVYLRLLDSPSSISQLSNDGGIAETSIRAHVRKLSQAGLVDRPDQSEPWAICALISPGELRRIRERIRRAGFAQPEDVPQEGEVIQDAEPSRPDRTTAIVTTEDGRQIRVHKEVRRLVPVATPSPTTARSATVIVSLGVIAGLGVALWVLVLVVRSLGGAFSTGSNGDDKWDAIIACEDDVESRLKSPSSADFGGESAEQQDDDSWSVTGHVDAENSFGATLRTDWVCSATYSESETSWSTSSIFD